MRLSDQFELINSFRSRPPVNVEGLADALGLDVQYAYLESGISGMLERRRDGKGYTITVNANDPPTRQRFTISHELGHYMLHRGLVGDGVDDDRAYRSTEVGRYHNTAIGPKQETEANRFAANVLMPYDQIELKRGQNPRLTPRQLADMFMVSEHAMCIRLGIPYEPPQGP